MNLRIRTKTFGHWISLVALFAFGGFPPARAQSVSGQLRPLRPEDQHRLERLGGTAVSPDGELLAYTLTRSVASGISKTRNALTTMQRYEIWVVPIVGGPPKRIASGEDDGTGFMQPLWSSDSQRLLLESVNADGDIGMWVWERVNGVLRRLLVRGLAVESGLPQWLSTHEVLCALSPDGAPAQFSEFRTAADQATKGWTKGFAGREPSLSVLESGIPQAQPQGSLAVVDINNGKQRRILAGNCSLAHISPAGSYAACLRSLDTTQVATGGPLREGPRFLLGLSVATIAGKVLANTEAASDVVPFSLRWSPDSSRLAVIARSRQAADAPLEVFLYRPADQTLSRLNIGGIVPVADYYRRRPQMLWTSRNELLLYARAESTAASRVDWWLLTDQAPPRNVTGGMKAAPAALLPESGSESFLGIAQGKLWRIHPDRETAQDLSGELPASLTSIYWPRINAWDAIDYSAHPTTILVSAQRTTLSDYHGETSRNAAPGVGGVDTDFFAYDLANGKLDRLKTVPTTETFLNFSPQRNTLVTSTSDRSGTRLWLSNTASGDHLVQETNTFVREIGETQWKRIEYRGLDGQSLTGWVQLPFGYQEGRRYPLITRVYAGEVFGSAPPTFQGISDNVGYGEGALLSARGYAVLFPSMPRLAYGTAHDNYLDLTKGVLPAVDKVIDLGIADPKRLGLIGTSYGGFSVYGLITQTNRFQAAVALAGPADFVSIYGQFNGATRYSAFPQADLTAQETLAETGQFALGAPPWQDVERYIRNSPVFYANSVETPVLIIQGDMDFVPIQQGEEFFTAMYRQGKRARFLRYWSDGHVINGANRLDMWKQIYAWFDEFLQPVKGRHQ